MTSMGPLTSLILVPLGMGFLLLWGGASWRGSGRFLALGCMGVSLAQAWSLSVSFDGGMGGLQFVERHSWIPQLQAEYFLGVDGLGLVMVLLTVFVVPLALLVAWEREALEARFCGLLLCLESGLLGTFTALNFFHWFLFWELSLIPAYFLVRFWGGARRLEAALQFFIYTMAGSAALLLAFLGIFAAMGSLDFIRLAELGRPGADGVSPLAQGVGRALGWSGLSAGAASMVIFGGVMVGLAVKVPLMPFHSWLPPLYAEAPVSVTMVLTGVMSKMGAYGFLRIAQPLFPEETRQVWPLLLTLAVWTVVASAAAACAQRDLRRMLGYSSINHLGYCLLGIFAAVGARAGTTETAASVTSGVIFQMLSHGLVASGLFACVGILETRSGGRRDLGEYGGVRATMPVFAGLAGFLMFASIGLPGLSGFVGEFLILRGTFALAGWAAALSLAGLLLTAVFLLGFWQKVFHGPSRMGGSAGWADIGIRERVVLGLPVGLVLLLGLFPDVVLRWVRVTAVEWAAKVMIS